MILVDRDLEERNDGAAYDKSADAGVFGFIERAISEKHALQISHALARLSWAAILGAGRVNRVRVAKASTAGLADSARIIFAICIDAGAPRTERTGLLTIIMAKANVILSNTNR